MAICTLKAKILVHFLT